MFTQRCYIRKNTPEIINRLIALKILHNNYDNGDRPWIAFNYGMWISVDEGYDKLFPDEIDCGDNEELFLALVALRDDTDKNQWFICDKEYITDNIVEAKIGDWIYIFEDDLKKLPRLNFYDHFHKATPAELIKHFNKK